MLECDKTARSI